MTMTAVVTAGSTRDAIDQPEAEHDAEEQDLSQHGLEIIEFE